MTTPIPPRPIPPRSGRSLAAALGAALLSLGTALPALAQESAPERLTPAQQEKIFPERRSQLVRHQRERIRIMQNGERCMSAARDAKALNGCLRQERQQNQAEREKHRQAMRGIYERNGIQLPVGGPGSGRWRKGGGDGGGGGN